MTGIDWAGLMQVGLHGLGMQPQDFWRLTPVELRIKLGAAASTAPLSRARLEDLARAFPDVKKGTEHG
ncbi:rcc01693 family protein [Pseudorhodobacter aquimaris]|uniref:rcc01693 family protein n=1 Tax=Pseudorhodobacter aquimaris TaxID=687412 RepID=UPI00067E5D06|nr:rcc01693 family protein [Pseudorhodobacter aquimaris]